MSFDVKRASITNSSSSSILQPKDIPWPENMKPVGKPFATAPADTDSLPQVDVLVVTWTSGEARTFAQLATGNNFNDWVPYRNNVEHFIPMVTGDQAPFNDQQAGENYYHTLGLYYPFQVGGISCLVMKSGLHMAYDGPAVPLVDFWLQIIAQAKPKMIITTGTGGGIGSVIQLGDVLIASNTRFDLAGILKGTPFEQKYGAALYPTSQLNESAINSLATSDLFAPNGQLLETPRTPVIIFPSAPNSNLVSTDTFAFDDSTDYFGLQQLGTCCDMGDSTLGVAIQQLGTSAPLWTSIRNASDPQIADPENNINEAKQQAENIYEKYQQITTASSVIATMATIIATLGVSD
jgi:nucleoside phosphorylase